MGYNEALSCFTALICMLDVYPQNFALSRRYQKVAKKLPNLGFKAKEKLPNRCFRTIWEFLQVVPPGIEPGTQGFSVLCSTN